MRISFVCLKVGTSGELAPSGSVKGGEFLDTLSECQLLKQDSAS
jgi:hypothetical protein